MNTQYCSGKTPPQLLPREGMTGSPSEESAPRTGLVGNKSTRPSTRLTNRPVTQLPQPLPKLRVPILRLSDLCKPAMDGPLV